MSRSSGLIATLTLLLTAQACASAGQSWRAGPAGIPAENRLRAQLESGEFGSALEAMKDKQVAPADALLRNMYRGLIAVHAGQHEAGARALDRAWAQIDDRYTKRLSTGVESLVTGEGALPYYPGPAERMLVPYYGGLNWLARNERDGTAVEARRLASVLESDADPLPERRFQGLMRYVSGVMFEVAGERNDAEVAYRNAQRLLDGRLPGDTLPPDGSQGDVVVLIEDGFVARPEPARVDFWVAQDEVALLSSNEGTVRFDTYRTIDRRRGLQRDWRAENFRNVSLRWPEMTASRQPGVGRLGARATPLQAAASGLDTARLDGGTAFEWPLLADSVLITRAAAPFGADVISASVSDAVRADFERRQPGLIARALARAAVREVSLKGAAGAFEAAGDVLTDDEPKKSRSDKGKKGEKRDDDDEKGGGAWLAAGLIALGIGLFAASMSSEVLDQPDLRAWQLLPDRVTVARMRLPVGEHAVEVTRDGEAWSLGTVTVKPGSVTVLVHRWWPGGAPVMVAAPAANAGVGASVTPPSPH